jgi:transcriptional regulator with XRE-family HTH domain
VHDINIHRLINQANNAMLESASKMHYSRVVNDMTTGSNSELSEFLKMVRLSRKMSLRDVEEACGVSNAYLSQVEQGKKPSPQILHRLAEAYGVGYDKLMEKAGYISKRTPNEVSSKHRSGRLAAAALGELSGDEERELLKYLAYIRSLKR